MTLRFSVTMINRIFSNRFFSRMHATLQPALSVGRSVTLCFSGVYVRFWGYSSCPTAQLVYFITAPAQLPSWSISSLPLPTHTRLGQPCIWPCFQCIGRKLYRTLQDRLTTEAYLSKQRAKQTSCRWPMERFSPASVQTQFNPRKIKRMYQTMNKRLKVSGQMD